MAYLTQTDPSAGGVSLLMGLVWLAMVLVGAQMLRTLPPSNPVRAAFRRRTALGGLVLGGLGLLQLLVRWLDGRWIQPDINNIPYLDWRLWSYLLLAATLGFFGYMLWYRRTRYADELSASRHVRVVRPVQQRRPAAESRPATSNGTLAPDPRPEPITSRRDARRDRKRRKR